MEIDPPSRVQPAQCRQEYLPGKTVKDIGKIKEHHAGLSMQKTQNLIFYMRSSRHRKEAHFHTLSLDPCTV